MQNTYLLLLVSLVCATASQAMPIAKSSILDLSRHKLPIKIVVPACARLSTPQVILEDNKQDVIFTCPSKDDSPAFAIQVGLAKGKVTEKDIEGDALTFKRWTKKTAAFLQWEEKSFGRTVHQFMVRKQVAGTEYACFNQFPAADAPHLSALIAACESMRPL